MIIASPQKPRQKDYKQRRGSLSGPPSSREEVTQRRASIAQEVTKYVSVRFRVVDDPVHSAPLPFAHEVAEVL